MGQAVPASGRWHSHGNPNQAEPGEAFVWRSRTSFNSGSNSWSFWGLPRSGDAPKTLGVSTDPIPGQRLSRACLWVLRSHVDAGTGASPAWWAQLSKPGPRCTSVQKTAPSPLSLLCLSVLPVGQLWFVIRLCQLQGWSWDRSGPAPDFRVDRTLSVGLGPGRKFTAGLTSGRTLLRDGIEEKD